MENKKETKIKKHHYIDWDKVKGTIFLIVFVGCCAGFVIFMSLGMWFVGGTCFIVGVLSWFVAALIAYIDNKKWKSKKSKERYVKQNGLVVNCRLATEKDVKEDILLDANLETKKYKIIVSYNNKNITVYSRKAFKPGDSITIMVNQDVPLGHYRSIIIWE